MTEESPGGVRKIAILGTADSWGDAPFGKKGWQIWVCNRAGLKMKPWDKLFEIHTNWDYENTEARDEFLSALRAVKLPQEVISVVPIGGKANKVIDRDALFKKYGAMWFSSTFAYMVAYALEQKPKEIGFFGVDMESREEYLTQFYGVRHFIDLAKSRGIKVTIPDRSLLTREPNPYPDRFENAVAHTLEQKAKRIVKYIEKAEKEALEAHTYAAYLRGRSIEMKYDSEDYSELSDRAARWDMNARKWEKALWRAKGELWATQHYKRLFVWNVLPPDLGEETEYDTEDSGPI